MSGVAAGSTIVGRVTGLDAPVTVLDHTALGLAGHVEATGVTVVEVPRRGDIDQQVHGDVLVTIAAPSENTSQAVGLGARWIHLVGTGIDHFPHQLLTDGQTLTCTRGGSAIPISEWVLAHMLAHAKRIPEVWIHDVPDGGWRTDLDIDRLHQRTVTIVGLGGIGTAVAERCLAFGMSVLAVRRTNRPSPVDGVELVPDLREAVARSDHLVLAVPATADTDHLVNAAVFAACKPGLHLLNVGRGRVVDESALREALDAGIVSRASLDTVDPEPLPSGHWMLTHPRVRLTPHVSWQMPGALSVHLEVFGANLQRWLHGEPLDGVVDVEAGY
jgi:phosphoglycerate dehydrogenase-like enzyme